MRSICSDFRRVHDLGTTRQIGNLNGIRYAVAEDRDNGAGGVLRDAVTFSLGRCASQTHDLMRLQSAKRGWCSGSLALCVRLCPSGDPYHTGVAE